MAININIPIENAVTDGSLNPVTSNAVFDAIANKVPYTGATANVDLGEFELKSGQIEFDQTPTGTSGVAVMRWNDTDGTVDLGLKGGNVTLQVGQEQVLRVVNKTATNVNLLESNYQAVRVTGAQGQRLKVDLAQATNDLLSAETIGLVTETINDNEEGFITTSGLIRNINTTGSIQGETWVDGDVLYLSPTVAGRVTNVKPSAPNHLVIIGYVVSAHITQGSIFVKVDNGYELDELHNVDITSPTNGQVLQYESATSLWKNATPSGGGITVGTTAVTSGTVGRVFFQGVGDVVQQDSSLFWDNTNKRLGVGATPATTVRLDVRAQGALSTDIAFRVRNSANTDNIISVKGNRNIFLLGETENGRIELSATGGNATMKHRASAVLPSLFKIQSFGDGGSVGQIQLDAFDGLTPAFTVQRLISGLSDLTGATLYSGFGTNAATFVMKNALNYGSYGVIPTGTAADHFAMYSADITAGNAAPHFRTENGNIIKLYQQSSAGITTVAQLVTVMQNLGLLS